MRSWRPEERLKSHALSLFLVPPSPSRSHQDRARPRSGCARAVARRAGRRAAGGARQDDDPGMGRPRGAVGRLGPMEPVFDRLEKTLAFDHADATARLEMAQRRAIEKVPRRDWAGRSAAEIMP